MNLFYLKDNKMQLCKNIIELNRTKDCQPINLESNNVGVASLTKFYNFFFKYVNFNHYKKILKN